ncbi:MAG: hypothetical protein NTV05_11670 [Acidobacteria bacterium]|nr:hypothetical protein [Acidobacteriota bacterium]
MPKDQKPNRRDFLGTVLKSSVAGTVAALGTLPAFGQITAPRNVRIGSKSVISPRDLTWLGAWKTAGTFNGSYSGPALGLRYVSGERRFLFHEWNGGVGIPGDIVEMKAPASPTLYTGTDMANAPAMIETRRWAAADWAPAWYISGTFAQGGTISDLYWDDAHGVLWFAAYGPYSAGLNVPAWGAVQLLDTVKTGVYRNVGTKYGPWSYVTTDIRAAYTYARMVNQWIIPVPPDERSLVNGAKFLIGAGHTGYNGDAPLGPNLHAMADFTTGMANPVPMVKQLAEYSPLSPLARRGARRSSTNYYDALTDDSTSYTVVDGEGSWNGTGMISGVKGAVWVDTGAKHGLIMFGCEGQGGCGYWHHNPKGDAPYPTLVDPTLPTNPDPGNGPKASEHYLWLRIFNPDHFAEVYAGTRCPYADTYLGKPGMRYAHEVNMRTNVTNGANIPLFYSLLGNATQPRVTGPNTDYGGAEWDATARQIIWMQYGTAPRASVLSFFSVS